MTLAKIEIRGAGDDLLPLLAASLPPDGFWMHEFGEGQLVSRITLGWVEPPPRDDEAREMRDCLAATVARCLAVIAAEDETDGGVVPLAREILGLLGLDPDLAAGQEPAEYDDGYGRDDDSRCDDA